MFAFSRGELSSFAWETSRGVGAARSRPTSGIGDTTWRIRDLSSGLKEEGRKKESSRTRSGGGEGLFLRRGQNRRSAMRRAWRAVMAPYRPLSIDDKRGFASADSILPSRGGSSLILQLCYQNDIKKWRAFQLKFLKITEFESKNILNLGIDQVLSQQPR